MSLPTAHSYTHSYSKSTVHNTDVIYMEMCLYILKPVHSDPPSALLRLQTFTRGLCFISMYATLKISHGQSVFFHYEQ